MKQALSLSAALTLCLSTIASAEALELDWKSTEIGFFENRDDTGQQLHGIAVYVPGNRMATEDDFSSIVPEFCGTNLRNLLELISQIEDAPEVHFLKLQIDFYGPKIGDNQTYIARSSTIPLENGLCIS